MWITALLALQGTTTPTAPTLPASIPAPPPKNQWVVDEAGLLDSAGRQVVDSITRTRAGSGMPVFVLTIRSVAAHDSTDMTFEEFSKETFSAWRKGVPGSDHAALLLVSAEDRRARIETGPAWGHDHDAMLQRVIEDAIEPSFSRNSLDQGIPTATHEITWVLQAPPVSPWMREGIIGAGVIGAGALTIGFLRRRRTTQPVAPPAAAEQPRPMAAIDPKLRVSQRLQAIDEARKHSEKAASTIAWLDTGELPKYEGELPPDSAAPSDPAAPAADDDEE